MRKASLLIATLFLLAGASTSFAEYEGIYAGTGSGYCLPYKDMVIYSFQTWQGQLTLSQTLDEEWLFEGTWQDEKGNHGTLKNCKLKYIYDPYCPYLWSYQAGSWYWLETVNGVEIPRLGGFFSMFVYVAQVNNPVDGIWGTIGWPGSPPPSYFEGHNIPPDAF